MDRKIQIIIGAVLVVGILVAVLFQSVQSTVFFYDPHEIIAKPADFEGRTIRIGAMVVPGSTKWNPDKVRLEFKMTDLKKAVIPVVFDGVKPDMFREGQGVVVEGRLENNGSFSADQVLVKHSEEYAVESMGDKKALLKTFSEQ